MALRNKSLALYGGKPDSMAIAKNGYFIVILKKTNSDQSVVVLFPVWTLCSHRQRRTVFHWSTVGGGTFSKFLLKVLWEN